MTKKYMITVPPPKAKRMNGRGKLILTLEHGWEPSIRKEIAITGPGSMEFEVPDKYEWIYNSSVSDGDHFTILIEYTNENYSRKQIITPVPERIL